MQKKCTFSGNSSFFFRSAQRQVRENRKNPRKFRGEKSVPNLSISGNSGKFGEISGQNSAENVRGDFSGTLLRRACFIKNSEFGRIFSGVFPDFRKFRNSGKFFSGDFPRNFFSGKFSHFFGNFGKSRKFQTTPIESTSNSIKSYNNL